MYDPANSYATAVLVTGATGAIGRAVCRELVTHNYRVLGLAHNEAARRRLPYGVVSVSGDVRNPAAWDSAIDRADVVIHLAVPAEIGSGKKDRAAADRDADELAAILDRLCDTTRRHKKRFIHTFGALLYEPDADGWVRETSALAAGRGFGIRHARAYALLTKHRKRGLRAMSVNPTFMYGPGGWFESAMLEPMSQGQSAFAGDGMQTMHFIEAADTAVGYRLAIENGLDGDDYLLSDDKPTTLGEFTRLVAREMGAPAPISIPEEELIPVLGDWAVEAYTYCPKVDSTRARERLGWSPRYRTIEEGVPEVVRAWKRARRLAA